MKPRRTHDSNAVFVLDGGTEDNDLWAHKAQAEDGHPVISSTWELTDAERQEIAAGAQVELIVWGEGTPPVLLRVCNHPLGAAPRTPKPTETT